MAVATRLAAANSSCSPPDVGPVFHLTEMIVKSCKPEAISVPLSAVQIAYVEASVETFLADFNRQIGETKEIYKTYVETAIRSCFWAELISQNSFVKVEWILRFAIACVDAEIVDSLIPYILFQEACDWGDSEEKEEIANLFVDLKDKWRSTKFSVVSCRHLLIRFTTELLSRLPKTTSAKARGRLLCYVSARIPMSDKGAANTAGELNNGRCPTTEGLTTGVANNVHQNSKFVHLSNFLDYLKNPNLVLTEKGFVGFKMAFEPLLELMTPKEMNNGDHEEGEHVEDGGRIILTSLSGQDGAADSPRGTKLNHVRFIPDPSAVETDLNQDRIKRNILTRFLIVCQYICLPAKPKGSFEATEEQLIWCDLMVQTALAILSRTNPNGPSYVERITDHLESEAAMSVWKDAGCPPLPSLPKADLSSISPYPLKDQLPYPKVFRQRQGRDRPVLRKSIRDGALFGARKMAGSGEFAQMLNRGPNTPEEFQNLGYQPPPIEFFIPVVEQAASGAKMKDIYNEKFQWRALRILGKRTHIHFSNEAEKMDTKDIGTFLENYIMNLAERNPTLQAAKLAHAAAHPIPDFSTDHANGNMDADPDQQLLSENLDDLMDQDVPEENGGPIVPEEPDSQPGTVAAGVGHSLFTKEQIRNIASQIAGDWERFAVILKFDTDLTEYWKTTYSDPVEQAEQMLQVWMEALSDSGKDSNDELDKFLGALKDNYNFDL